MPSATVSVSAADEADALARVQSRLIDGITTTGRTGVRSAKHLLFLVELEVAPEVNHNDAWVHLTSYGICPAKGIESMWEALEVG